jgi:antitoxin HicB
VRYTVVMVPDQDDGGYAVYVPAIPNCFTQARIREEGLERAADVAAVFLASFAAHGEEIPGEGPGVVVDAIEVGVPEAIPA